MRSRGVRQILTRVLSAIIILSTVLVQPSEHVFASESPAESTETIALREVQTSMYASILAKISQQSVINDHIEKKKSTDIEKERAYTRISKKAEMYVIDDEEAYFEQAAMIEAEIPETGYESEDGHLTPENGVYTGPSGKETYYNLPMGGVIYLMRYLGYSEEEYPYWIRNDGVKMFGQYVMVAADLDLRPKGTILESSMGMAIVCDTGDLEPLQLDIAVNW